eukprot:351707_1
MAEAQSTRGDDNLGIDEDDLSVLRSQHFLVLDDSPVTRSCICASLLKAKCSDVDSGAVCEGDRLLEKASFRNPYTLLLLNNGILRIQSELLTKIALAPEHRKPMKIIYIVPDPNDPQIHSMLDRNLVDSLFERPIDRGKMFKEILKVLRSGNRASLRRSDSKVKLLSVLETRNTVLVVDDNRVNQQILVKYITKFGSAKHIVANSGAEALSMVKRYEDIGFILMDCIMPGEMDGLQATRAIREFEIGTERLPLRIHGCTGNASQ